MTALRCRACGHEEPLRADLDQFSAAAEAQRRAWVVVWRHTDAFRRPFVKLYCGSVCFMERAA